MWRSVDLPAPFGPRSPVIPAPRAKLMSLTATTLPYQRDTRSSTIGWTRCSAPEGRATGVVADGPLAAAGIGGLGVSVIRRRSEQIGGPQGRLRSASGEGRSR